MITITIDKTYKLPENWSEIGLLKAQELFKLPVPPKLMEYWKSKIEKKDLPNLTERDLIKIFPEYYGKILTVFGVPNSVVKRILPLDRSAFFNAYLLEFVLGMHFSPNFESTNPEFIDYGEKLYFPKTKDLLDVKLPMAYTTAWEFSEMADLQIYASGLAEGKYDYIANIASVMCRPLGEEYNEDISLERAEKLKDMKMSDAWEVFFCLIELSTMQLNHDQMYLREVLTRKLSLPLKQRALVAGRTQLSKWEKRFKGLPMLRK